VSMTWAIANFPVISISFHILTPPRRCNVHKSGIVLRRVPRLICRPMDAPSQARRPPLGASYERVAPISGGCGACRHQARRKRPAGSCDVLECSSSSSFGSVSKMTPRGGGGMQPARVPVRRSPPGGNREAKAWNCLSAWGTNMGIRKWSPYFSPTVLT
jgi:hypothetical protein